jgi:hypothetical protein
MWWWIGSLGGLGLALMGWSAYSARRRRVAAEESPGGQDEEPKTPSERVLRASRRLRELISERGGESYRARTVEELGDSEELKEWLGTETFDRVIKILELGDQVKFADQTTTEDQGSEADSVVEVCRIALEGANSRMSGR